MSYDLKLEAGEQVILKQDVYKQLLGEPFFIAVTDQALYFPLQHQSTASEHYVTERLPLGDIKEVSVNYVFSSWQLVVGILILLYGGSTALEDLRHGRLPLLGAKVTLSVGFLLIGLVGRRALVVKLVHGRRIWKVPRSMKESGRNILDDVFARVLSACRKAGLHVTGSQALGE